MATASSKLQIIIDVLTGNSEQAVSGLESSFKKLSDVAVKTSAAVVGVAVAMDKIFEFGKAGAVIVQTGESFEFLMDKLGVTEDILWELSEASGHTISDMDLMSSTMTLLAGVSDELGTSLVANSPKLMEIAKAANALNPALGDTTFMYESLNTGIKRNSKMILDNLGIIIDLEDAYKVYADSIGKATDALTGEEQQMALLNATLKTGSQLIEQVGGDTASAVDGIARMETATKNAGDSFMAVLAPGITRAADAIYYLIDGTKLIDKAFEGHEKQVADTADSYTDYATEVMRAAQEAGYLTDYEARLYEQYLLTGDEVALLSGLMGGLSEEQMAVRFTTEELAAMTEELTGKVDILTESEFDLGRATSELTDEFVALTGATGDWEEAQRAAAEAAKDTAAFEALSDGLADGHDSAEELSWALGEVEGDLYGVGAAADEAVAALNTLDGSTVTLGTSVPNLVSDISNTQDALEFAAAGGYELVAATEALIANPDIPIDVKTEKLDEAAGLMASIQVDLGEMTEAEAAQMLFEELELTDLQAAYDLMVGGEQNIMIAIAAMQNMIGIPINYELVTAALGELTSTETKMQEIDGMVSTVTVHTNFTQSGQPSGGGEETTTVDEGNDPGERALGGPVSAGSSYLVGERGIEMFVPNVSGEIVPNNKLGSLGTTINQTNYVTNTNPLTAAMNQAFIDSSLTAEFRGQL